MMIPLSLAHAPAPQHRALDPLHWRLRCAALVISYAATGCGGGGGGDSAAAQSGATPATAAAAAPITFRNLLITGNFDWTTAQSTTTSVNLGRATGLALGGDVRVLVSNSICQHPDVGTLASPMATETIVSYALDDTQASRSQLEISLDKVQLPAATTQLLVEVLEGNSVLYSRRHSVASLPNLSLSFPDSAPAPEDTRYIDTCE